MKKYIKLTTVMVISFLIHSCSEDKILDLSPINNISNDASYTSPSLIALTVNGMYNAAQVGQYNSTSSNGGRGYIWGAAFVQQGDMRGEDGVNMVGFYTGTYQSTWDTGTPNQVYYWVDGYRLINRCNNLIEGVTGAISKGIITQAVGDDYIGQAKFLRAITHFELLTYFARPYNFTPTASHPGIPYREVGIDTQAEIDSELLKGRNTVAECYTKVLADLTDAEAKITQTADKSLVTKNAAIAFKTRVNLHKRDWQAVVTEASKTMTGIALTATPDVPFILASNLTNSETIFSIRHSATNNLGTNAGLASMYKARALISISPIIWRDPSWLADDKRRIEGSMVVTINGVKYTNKYKDVTAYTDATPVIRFAEVVLNRAEAQARLATTSVQLDAAITLLNSVRNRSLATPATQAYTLTGINPLTNQIGVLNAILKERRIEFMLEGRRWSDIHRLLYDDLAPTAGIPAKVGSGTPTAAMYTAVGPYTGPYLEAAIAKTDYRVLWPIPLLETNNNPKLLSEQNPGW